MLVCPYLGRPIMCYENESRLDAVFAKSKRLFEIECCSFYSAFIALFASTSSLAITAFFV